MTDLRFRAGALVALAALVLSGCGGGGGEDSAAAEMAPGARPMSAEVQSLVDQGNAAQREGRYQDAMDSYQQAMDQAPEHPVPQFGALMAATSLGDTALAASLTAQLRETAPELVGMLGSDGGMGGGMPANPHAEGEAVMPGMPPGHPAVGETPPAPDTTGSR